jgi:uncharacterized protein with PIN domain
MDSEYDFKRTVTFKDADVFAFQRCPRCGRFMKTCDAGVIINGFEEVREFEGFICSKCGEMQPNWDRLP